jgi:hypothetical protein
MESVKAFFMKCEIHERESLYEMILRFQLMQLNEI